jgi:hypothetical protein
MFAPSFILVLAAVVTPTRRIDGIGRERALKRYKRD